MRICFVCTGNICRSPTAQAILRTMLRGVADDVGIESAGTGDWYLGDDIDPRARAVLDARGYPYRRHVARQFDAARFGDYDLIVALDRGHIEYLNDLAADLDDPAGARAKIVLLRSFDAEAVARGELDVPDPGFGPDQTEQGFVDAFELIERGCRGLAATLSTSGGASAPQAQTLYEAAGGDDGLRRLAAAWHARVLADEVAGHPFSHGFHPDHTERLAAYWAEALGGPRTYSQSYGDESAVVRRHSGNGRHEELDARAIACFDLALDDAGFASNVQLAQALHDYFAWATTTTMARYPESADDVPDGLTIPRWSWDGRVPEADPAS
jgi:hemoglobin